MQKISKFLPLLFAAALCACASSPDIGYKPKEHAVYLTDSQLRDRQFAPAPLPDSDTEKADLAALLEWQAKRTPEQCAKGAAEAKAYFSDFFGEISPFVSPLPAEAEAFLAQVRDDADAAVNIIKKRNGRQRPFHRYASIEPCLGRIGGLAYPSGHAVLSRVYALILSELVPERREQFLAKADEGALYRVIGGVHHPSDIEAGKKFGDILYGDLMRNPAFRAEMDKMRAYIAK
jgi:acid phosphatase (class A)